MSLIIPSILLASLAAGCFGGVGPAEDVVTDDETRPDPPLPPTERTKATPNGSAAPPMTPFRFPLDRPVDVEHWTNGSFAPQETGAGGGFFTGAFVKEIELGDLLPAEVPARVQVVVTLDADEVPIAGPTARADPYSNGTVWYEGDWQQVAPGQYALDAVLKRAADGTFGVALEAYTPGPADPPEVSYSVHVRVAAHPEWIPRGVPVAVPLRTNDTILLEAQGPDPAELLVHGPDDRLVDRLYFIGSTEWTVPAGVPGAYVVLPIHGADRVRLSGDVGGALRSLSLSREVGEPHEVAPMDTTTWTFDLDVRPLRVLLTVLGPAGAPWICSGSADVRLDAPAGTLLERTADCPSPTNVPFLYAEDRTWGSDLGDARLVAGTYEVTVENTLWYGHRAYHTVETYER